MPMTIDWNEAAVALKREVDEHGGFLTLQRDTLRQDSASAALERGTARIWWTRSTTTGCSSSRTLTPGRVHRSASTTSKARSVELRWPSSNLIPCRRGRSSTLLNLHERAIAGKRSAVRLRTVAVGA